jgi:hypothetical protein
LDSRRRNRREFLFYPRVIGQTENILR